MNKTIAAAVFAALLAGCSPSAEQGAATGVEPENVEATQQEDFSAKWFAPPVTQVFEPDFDHHVRSVQRSVRDNGRIRIRNNMEIRGVSQQEAAERIERTFLAEGYAKHGREWRNGTYQANYRKRGANRVYVVIRDIADGQAYDSPDATGFLRISWTYRPASAD